MLLEFDEDQRLWQETVRDAVGKQCPPALVGIAEDGVDPGPVWKAYVEQGWTEMNDSDTAVELAIVLEELGRATDPTPFLATMSQFAPLAGDRFDPRTSGTAVYGGVAAHRDGEGWVLDGTARHVLDGDHAKWLAVKTDAAVFVVNADDAAGQLSRRRSSVFDPVLHVADVTFDGLRLPDSARVAVDTERAHHVALMGMAISMVGACQRILDLVLDHVRSATSSACRSDRSRRSSTRPPTCTSPSSEPGAELLRRLDHRRRRSRRRLAAAMAKAAAGECQSLVFRHGLQLFGAMGFTWENDLQFALKRAKAGELMLGGTAEHRARVTEEYRAAHL